MNRVITQAVLLLGLLLVGPRSMSLDAQNQAYLDQMEDDLFDHNAALVLGLGSSGVVGTTIEITEMSLNILLKTIPAVLEIPDDKFEYPNLGTGGDYRCTFSYSTPQRAATYKELLGLGKLRDLPGDWGDFGTPRVEHRNSSVLLSLGGIPDPEPGETEVFGEFSEGDHTLRWVAETQYSPFWDGAFPAAMAGLGILSEAKYAKVSFKPLSKSGTRAAAKLQDDLANVAKDIGIKAGLIGTQIVSDELNLIGDEQPFARHSRNQLFRVWDVHPPEFRDPNNDNTIETQTVAIEASDFGGARFNRIRDDLIAKFQPYDDCGRPLSLRVTNAPSLIPIGDTGVELEWVIQDKGIYNVAAPKFTPAANQAFLAGTPGDSSPARGMRTTLKQRVIVRDEQPPLLFRPASFAREATSNIALNNDPALLRQELGAATAIDLADPVPTITTTAPLTLVAPDADEDGRRYFITYDAEDDTGNQTVANSDNPEQYTQIVTLKPPGKNTAPMAQAPVGSTTVSHTPVSIRLTGVDLDPLINGMADPLTFNIVEPPANGEFVAPLFPTFIEDYRSKPSETPGDGTLASVACPSLTPAPGEPTLETQLGLLDVTDHEDFVVQCYCQNNDVPPKDFVYQPDYVHITDDNLYYVSDNPLVCNNQPGAPNAAKRQRLGTWRDGELINERLGSFANANANRTFDVDAQGYVWQLIIGGGAGASATATVERYQPDLVITGRERNLTVDSSSMNASQVVSSYADLEQGLLYVADKSAVAVFTLEGADNRAPIANLRNETDFPGLSIDAPCNTLPGVSNSAKVGFTMQTDSEGNLYVADSCAHQVHKFSPTTLNLDDSVNIGEYQGWLGKCTGNKVDPSTGVEFNHCVVADQASNGFACTNDSCEVDPFNRDGTGAGQFDVITHLNLDPNDTLYVADFTNQRVQRFGADGVFAGEAKSTGDGISSDSSFVLGNMGPPRHVSVNSSSFHVLERRPNVGDFFLHIFTTLPFTEVTNDGATVEYVSDISFIGTDEFSFLVDDGLAESAPATVSVTVNATQRPPEDLRAACFSDSAAQNQVACEVLEDEEIFLRLVSSDPDGFAVLGGLDTHEFRIVQTPNQGELTLLTSTANSAIYRYNPDANVNGTDEFTFQANDGKDDADEPGLVSLTITPVADDVVLTFPDDLRVARGFEESVSIEFNDPDQDPASVLRAQIFDWGDGVVAREDQGWVNIGVFDDEGNPVDPQRDTLPGQGLLVGAHIFDSNSSGYRITLQDGGSEVIATTGPISVEEVTRVNVTKQDGNDLQPDVDTTVSINITNEQPVGWSGLAANNVVVRIEVPDGITLQNAATLSNCTLATQLECDMGNLEVGATTTLDLVLRVSLAAARETTVFPFRTSQTDAGPRLDSSTESVFIVEVADSDDDGVIDADDRFPDNPDYSVDSDNDGTADAWEIDNGFDPNDPADASLDLDNDGFSNQVEFELNGAPRLADAYLASANLISDQAAPNQDRFGIALGAADINADGFNDVAIGSSTYAPNGAVFVHTGGQTVDNDALTRIDPPSGVTSFGRALAMGDLDGNGFADLAVGGSNSVSIYLATPSGLPATPDHVLNGGAADNQGYAIVIADIDDDNAQDLLFSAIGFSDGASEQGRVSVFRASSNWWNDVAPVASKHFVGTDVVELRFGASLSVGDIDGDNLADLLIASVRRRGLVHAFLGSSRDWTTASRVTPDVVIGGESTGDQFGWSIAADADVDADGIDDLVVGAYSHLTRGAVYLYSSRDEYWTQSVPTPADKVMAGSALDQFGVRVALLPASGTKVGADLLVGANRFEQGTTNDEGTFYLYNGGGLPLGTPQQQLSDRGHDMLGYQLVAAGDINGDGANDFVVGAPDFSVTGYQGDGGYVQLFFGGSTEPQADGDADGVSDDLDNCPSDANRNQQDTDGDSVGDVCDEDIDGDGVDNAVDNCPLVASANQNDFDDDGAGDVCDDDDDNDGALDADDAFPQNAVYQSDSDADGLPDAFETANGLNPNDAADASADLDGDGRNNLDEFQLGSNIAVDDVPPVLTIPGDLVVDATGIRTPVDLGVASASDAKDGSLTPTADNAGPFEPGRHLVVWTATDAAGNRVTQTQQVDVRPQVNFVGVSAQVPEGETATLTIELSGNAPEYPVNVTLTLAGNAQADVDYAAITTMVQIDTSNRVSVDVQTLADTDTEGNETVTLTLATATNAVTGSINEFTQYIVEGNVLVQADIGITQAGEPRTTVFADQSSVALQAQIIDPNLADTHLYDWTGTDPALIASEGPGSATFTFDPTGLANGLYRLQLTVVDSGEPAQPVLVNRWLKVQSSAPMLSVNADSDGDGASDVSEGYADADQDGVPAYRDADDNTQTLLMRVGDRAVMQTQPGLTLALGSTARAAGEAATVTLAQIAQFGSNGEPALAAADDDFAYLTDAVDFVIRNLAQPGDSTEVVIPLGDTISTEAGYRKYLTDLGWQSFVDNGTDAVASAPGSATTCPAPGNTAYQPGLNTGDRCVQLTLTDGGPNDGDGQANGQIVDPGGVAVPNITPSITLTSLSVSDKTVNAGQSNVAMLRFRLTSNTGRTRLGSLRLQASGSGDDAVDIRNVTLWADTDGDGEASATDSVIGAGRYSADNGSLTLNPTQPFDIPTGDSDYLVTYDY